MDSQRKVTATANQTSEKVIFSGGVLDSFIFPSSSDLYLLYRPFEQSQDAPTTVEEVAKRSMMLECHAKPAKEAQISIACIGLLFSFLLDSILFFLLLDVPDLHIHTCTYQQAHTSNTICLILPLPSPLPFPSSHFSS